MERYFYNETSLTCEKFIFGGCQGNENNFETELGCENACGLPVDRESRPMMKTLDFESGFDDWEQRDVSILNITDNNLEIPASNGVGHKIATAGREKEAVLSTKVDIASGTILHIEVTIFVSGFDQKQIDESVQFENPSFQILLVTKEGSVTYKVFDLSEIDSVENGAWKRYRYSLKSKSEIEDLTIRFVARSGESHVSIIAWDDVKLEYTEPGMEENNEGTNKIGLTKQTDDVQAGNTTIQSETPEPSSTKIPNKAEETENTLDQSKNETTKLGQTEAAKEIAPTKQVVDAQAEKRTIHEDATEANSTEILEEVTEKENTLDQLFNETTELVQTAAPNHGKTEQTSFKVSENQVTTMEDKAINVRNKSISADFQNNPKQTTTFIFEMLTNSDKNMNGNQIKKEKNITDTDEMHQYLIEDSKNQTIDEIFNRTETTIPVTAKHIDEFEMNNSEPNAKEDGSSEEGIVRETSHLNNKALEPNMNNMTKANVHDITEHTIEDNTTEHTIKYNTRQEEKSNISMMILNATTASSNTMDATESNNDAHTAQHIDEFYSNTTKLSEEEKMKTINESVAHDNDNQHSSNSTTNIEEEVTTKYAPDKSSYTKKVEIMNLTVMGSNDNSDTTMKYPMETSVPRPSQDNSEKTVALGLGWNTVFPGNQSIIYRVFTHVFNIGNSSNFSININIP